MRCGYHNIVMDELLQLCKHFYTLEGCAAGGPLHILLDDDNLDDDDILFCANQCAEHPDLYIRTCGMIICMGYFQMSMIERKIFDWYWNGNSLECHHDGACGECRLLAED